MKPQKKRELKLPEEFESTLKARNQLDESNQVEREWRLLSEFGMFYGWDAIKDVRNNKIDTDTFNMLIKAGRKIEAQRIVDYAHATFSAVAATKSKTPSSALKKALKNFYKEAK